MENKQQRQAWSERIAAYEASGLTMAAWSAKEGVTIHQLKYWLKRYRTTQPKPRTKPRTKPVSAFVPVAVLADPDGEVAQDGKIAISIGEIRIDLQSGFNPELLREIVHVLRLC